MHCRTFRKFSTTLTPEIGSDEKGDEGMTPEELLEEIYCRVVNAFQPVDLKLKRIKRNFPVSLIEIEELVELLEWDAKKLRQQLEAMKKEMKG
jgi:hypothetical protein